MALAPGSRLGPYEVVCAIGAGGMGEVYKAIDTNLKRAVAIKVLPASLAGDAERLARFQREAEVLAALNHPNIAAIHGLEKSAGVTALVMELVEGDDLSQRIARGAIPVDEALPIAKQIAEALEAAHEQGIIHRDLKPANVKVRGDGTVKVLDFGLAKAMEPTGAAAPHASMSPTITTPAMTQAGMILGTAAYMSPEQARGKTVDKRADIWAFGCVLWEMVTGERPFRGEDLTETLASVVKDEPPFERAPATLRRMLRACLEKDPRRRLRDIGDVWRLLGEEPAPRSSRQARTQGWMGWAAAALCFVAATALAIILFRQPARPTASLDIPTVRLTVQPTQVFGSPGVSEIALSPDGRHLVFADRGPTGKALWIRALDTGEVRLLPGTEEAWYPFWSPDSRFVGFYAARALRKVPAAGGPVQTISEAPSAGGATWSEAGTIVFGTDRGALFQASATGGPAVALTNLDRSQLEFSHLFPQFLRNGTTVLYFVGADRPERRGVYVRSLASSDAKRVLATDSPGVFVEPGFILTLQDQVLLAYPFSMETLEVSGEPVAIADGVGRGSGGNVYPSISAAANGVLAYGSASGIGVTQLVWSDRAGRRLGHVGSPETVTQVRLSSDGTRAALLKRDPKANVNDIWVTDLSTQVSAKLAGDSGDPIWSPDGQRVAYYAKRGGGDNALYDRPIGGGEERLLLASPGNVEDWTKDGQSIIFRRSDGTFLLPLSGARSPVPLLSAVAFQRNQFHLSPNGHWIAYTSFESGRGEVWVASFPTFTDRRQVSNNGGDVPRWRNDQRELYYLAPDGGMMSVDVTIGPTIETGPPTRLFQTGIRSSDGFDRYDVTGDGQRFLLIEPPESAGAPPITVITNWTSLLRR